MTLPDLFSQTVLSPFWRWFLFGPCALVLLDLLTGCVAALIQKKFTLKDLPRFLGSDVLPLILACLFVVVGYCCFGGAAAGTAIANVIGMGAISTMMVSSIQSNIAEIFTRAPLPQSVQQVIQDIEKTSTTPPPTISTMNTTIIPKMVTLPSASIPTASNSLAIRAQMEQSSVFPAVTFPKNL